MRKTAQGTHRESLIVRPKVFIYIDSEPLAQDRARPGSLVAELPRVTNDNELSFNGVGMFFHGHCMEAWIGRRPYETSMVVFELQRTLPRMPFVRIIELSQLRRDLVNTILATRRTTPLAVFILYGTDREYELCVKDVPDDWRVRLDSYFRLRKYRSKLRPSELRQLLDVATATAEHKVRSATVFSAFISYSHKDKAFARWLHATLSEQGIRCWLDEKKLKAGDRLHSKIDSAIREREKVLLCASEASLTSWWVDNELNSVITKEQALWRQTGAESLVLIPLNLDGFMFSESWKSGWKNQVISRLAPDFTNWDSENTWLSDASLHSVIRALIVDEAREGSPLADA